MALPRGSRAGLDRSGLPGPSAPGQLTRAHEPRTLDRGGTRMPAELRCTLTLPGAVALGAYEGGALAAVLSALRGIRENAGEPEVRIDSICACSSGSVTALLVARCLVEGLDPVRVLHKAWVTEGNLRTLFARGVASPLDFTALRTAADALLSVPSDFTPLSPQRSPVKLSFGLGNL